MSEWTLKPHAKFPGVSGPVVVCVMDGVGIGRQDESDAVWLARTPRLDRLAASVPTRSLRAHGYAVGMPSGEAFSQGNPTTSGQSGCQIKRL